MPVMPHHIQIFGILEALPLPQASSSRRPWTRLHAFWVHDLMVLSRIKDRLIGKKEKAISRILASAMDQDEDSLLTLIAELGCYWFSGARASKPMVKESRNKSIEVDVIIKESRNKSIEVDVIIIEDLDDESKPI
ncbi:hypothetical protein FXO38_06011 [Capsicum annuum]|nr:hypothetical protein FXO37_12234 [Capsicum annuum]KAF3672611.1 hypothetical protein FXO38_06011 [Capsicum annuum]